jgi:hypothetical protein
MIEIKKNIKHTLGKNKKKIKTLVIMTMITLVLPLILTTGNTIADDPPAGTIWYFQLNGVDGYLELGEYYTVNIYFIPEDMGDPGVGNDGANNLAAYFLDIDFDADKLECTGVQYYDYQQSVPPFDDIWDGGILPTTINNEQGYIYDVNGAEPLGSTHVYYPDEANNHLAKIWFTAKVTGLFEDLMTWVDPDIDSLAKVDDVVYNLDPLIIWKNGTDLCCTYLVEYYYLHLGINQFGQDDFPKEIAMESYYSGVASARQALRFLDSGYSWASQGELYTLYHSGGPETDLSAPDLATLLTTETNNNPETQPYNFLALSSTDQEYAIKRILYWIDYEVGGGVEEPNAPAHIPASGGYNWMTVRGFVTDVDPNPTPPTLIVYGLWLNDPKVDGLGYNVYMTADTFKSNYQQVDGSYRYVAEPPVADDLVALETQINSVSLSYAQGRQNKELSDGLNQIKNMKSSMQRSAEMVQVCQEIDWDTVIPEELLASEDFYQQYLNAEFKHCLIVVDRDSGEEYEVALFGPPQRSSTYHIDVTLALLLDSEGTFCQASWTQQSQQYLTEKAAQELAIQKLLKKMPVLNTNSLFLSKLWKTRIIWSEDFEQSLFRPIYEITTPLGLVFYVLQDGTVTIKKFTLASSNNIPIKQEPESFEQKAMQSYPLLSIDVIETKETDKNTCAECGDYHQVWIRIHPGKSGEAQDIMDSIASLYMEMNKKESVTVKILVGDHVMMQKSYQLSMEG